jgi:hypothetical protein
LTQSTEANEEEKPEESVIAKTNESHNKPDGRLAILYVCHGFISCVRIREAVADGPKHHAKQQPPTSDADLRQAWIGSH